MAVHNLDVWTSQTDASGNPIDIGTIRPAFRDWVTSHNERLETQSADLTAGNTELDGTGADYFHGSWRFAWTDDPVQAKDGIAAYLSNNFTWWRIRYHACDHDEAERGGCSWDNSWEGGTVPAGVPTI